MYIFSIIDGSILISRLDGTVHSYVTNYELKTKVFVIKRFKQEGDSTESFEHTFMKYVTTVVSLIFLPKTLI